MKPVFLRVFAGLCVFLASLVYLQTTSFSLGREEPLDSSAGQKKTVDASVYGKLPQRFEANRGQTDASVKFISRGRGFTVFLTESETVLQLQNGERQTATLRMKPVNANPAPRLTGLDELPGKSSYFTGRDARQWITGVRAWGAVKYEAVWPGVDLVWHGNQQQLEHDFVVAPGADAAQIKLEFDGARRIAIDREGVLRLSAETGELRLLKPVAWQEADGKRHPVHCDFRLRRSGKRTQVGFRLGRYDRRLPLVIDPVLAYSTFLGGNSFDSALAVAVDKDGSVYVTGNANSTNFPGSTPIHQGDGGFQDVFVLKLNPAGSAISYATWIGGSGNEFAASIAVDAAGQAYVAGFTASVNFPATSEALQKSLSGNLDAFVAKLNAGGSALLYSTYLGGGGSEQTRGIAVTSTGQAVITGQTDSSDFPATVPGSSRSGVPIFKTTIGVNDWMPKSNGLTAPFIRDMAIDPTAPATIYACSSLGLHKSTDGGNQWTFVGAPPPVNNLSPAVLSLAIDPKTPSVIYLATTAGIYKSVNGGQRFEAKNIGIPVQTINAMAIDPATPTTIYAVGNQNVFKSVNGAESWTPANNGLTGQANTFRKLAIDPVTPATVYLGTNRGVFKTINGAASWGSANNGLNPAGVTFGPNVTALVIDPNNPAILYAGIQNSLGAAYKSVNGGVSWQVSDTGLRIGSSQSNAPPTLTALAISPSNSSVIYAGSDFGIWKSVNGGVAWSAVNNGLTNPTIRALAADVQGNVFAGTLPGFDVFVAQLNPTGSALEYARYLGGAQDDIGYGVAVDAANNVWLTGATNSTDFPVSNAFQSTKGGSYDGFVAKLDPAGAILFAGYLGGTSADESRSIALDAAGNAYLAGWTLSDNFPLANPLKAVFSGFRDVFVAKIMADGSGPAYSTYLGGARSDLGFGIATDNNGGVWVTGISESADFPVVNPLYPSPTFNPDAFVAHLNAAGSRLLFSTYIGGSGTEQGNGIAVDPAGNVYVTGITNSSDFPLLKPLQTNRSDTFVLKLAAVADLAVAINESRDPVMVNNNLIYTLTVTNKGPDNAVAVTLTDTLPAGVAFVSATAGQGTCSGSATVACNLGEVESNAAVTVTITVRPSAMGTLDNRATVSSATPDPTLENNSATEQTRVSTLPSLAGLVTQTGGAGVGGVTVGLSGAQTAATMTNAAGFYQFAELTVGGNYNVAPARQGFVFNPPSRSFTNVTQDQTANFTAVACLFTITPVNRAFSANGGSASVAISSPDPLCPWTARANVPWITVTSAAGGNGNGMVTFNVAATTAARSGTLTIAGRSFTVWQDANVCGLPDFVMAKSVVAGNAPLIAVSADFNRDGKADVAMANDDSKITVLLGAAGGGFGEPISFNSVSRFTALATGDFNGDGNADLAATFFDRSNNVVVHLGTGAGTFGAARIFSADTLPSALAVADFNGDNKQDLAVANEDASNVSILFGMGDGGFGQAVNLGGQGRPFRPKSIVAGDFTGDGKADVVVTGSNNLELIPGNGQGGFGAMVSLNAGFNPGFIVAEDLNADGRLDLAVGNTFEGRGNISILLANASGGFNAPTNITLTQLPLGGVPHLVVGDLNADGKKDLVATVSATASIIPLLGDGAGKFTLSASFTSGLTPRAAVLGEFTGDGKADVLAVIGRTNGNGLLSLFPGDGAGGLIAARNYAAPFQPRQLVNADFTGDGKTDLLILGGTCQLTNCAGNGSVMLRAGNGVGGFNVGSEFEVGNNPIAMVTGDFNNDGKPDVAAANAGSNNVSILLNNGNGGFGNAMNISVAVQPRAIATGDFNNDGKNDLVVTHVAPAINQILMVLLGNGAGGFSNPTTITSTQPFFSVEAGDLNGDGNADLVASNYSAAFGGSNPQRGIYVLPGNGGGGFGAASQISTELATEMELFDFNGDGFLDIAAATGDDKLSFLFGTGAGNFAAPVSYALRSAGNQTTGPRAMALADFNSDGRPDVIVTNSPTASVEILLGNGVGGFGVPLAFWVGRQPVSVTAGDFNGDGRMDLATANANSTATVLLNACPANSNAPATTVSAAAFTRPLTSDAIAAVFGAGLATSTQVATTIPLPTQLAGTTVKVRDGNATERFAPLFFVSPGQINFLVPPGTAVGTAVITITSGNGTVSVGTASINDSAPALFTANGDGQSVAAATVLRVKADGSLLYESVARFDSASNRFVPAPIDFGPDLGTASDRLFLVLFGTGLRNRSSSFLQVKIGELTLGTLYVGPQGDFVGLDQINVQLPRSSALRGETDLKLDLGNSFSNTVKIGFK